MILTKTHVKILKVFKKNLNKDISIEQIMKKTGRISRAWLFRFIEILSKKGILIKTKLTNINLYRLNLSNIDAINYLSYLDIIEYSSLVFDKSAVNSIVNTTKPTYCLILFGSYSKGTQKKDSDMDICFLIKNAADKKKIKPFIENIKLKSVIPIHDCYILEKEFKEMLLSKEENLGKQIYEQSVIIINHFIYYSMVLEAIKNGFEG